MKKALRVDILNSAKLHHTRLLERAAVKTLCTGGMLGSVHSSGPLAPSDQLS